MSYTDEYLGQVVQVVEGIDRQAVDALVELLVRVRQVGGRLFILGVGGSAGNAGHAVNDFRKLAGMEAYAPTDNVSELTARINDDGWDTSFARWLEGSRLQPKDLVLVFSVGGGHRDERERQFGEGVGICPERRGADRRHRWPRRRLYRSSCRCVRGRANG